MNALEFGDCPDRIRRIGMLMSGDETDPSQEPRFSAFTQALADLGWTDGRNARVDVRWAGGDANRIRALAQELVGVQPDIVVTNSTLATVALQRETRTIPIVLAGVNEPVASGIVERLDRPSGNVTGFASLEATLGGKWLARRSAHAAKNMDRGGSGTGLAVRIGQPFDFIVSDPD